MLKINDLYVNYGNVQALQGVNIVVEKNEIVALVGNNGAGKSTLLRTISGQIKPVSGSIEFLGQDITGLAAYKITKMGIAQVPEGRKIFYKLTVKENLVMGAYTQKDKKKIQETLDHVLEIFPKLAERIKQTGGTLSGGEQQMLALGRALMSNPKLLLLDEPSLGLAPLVVETIMENIISIAKSGIPILLVEQNAKLALEISDRGYVIDTGYIQLNGRSSELAANSDIQKAFLGI